MEHTGGNEHFLTWCRPDYVSADVEFHFSLQHHDHFIDGVPVIIPDLAGRICPGVAAEPSRLPVRSDLLDAHGPCHSVNVPLSQPCTQVRVEHKSGLSQLAIVPG